jgi:hypothetical protein
MINNLFKRKTDKESKIEKLTPPRSGNWNYEKLKGNYVKQFSSKFIEFYFPYLLRSIREFRVSSDDIKLLDVGCGWGPMAIPCVLYEGAQDTGRRNQIRYLGIDIRQDAISWLSLAYRDYPFVNFKCHQATKEVDYINAEYSKLKTISKSNGEEGTLVIPSYFIHNVQWSSSVFTHLTPEACTQALKSIRASCESNSIQVNTWLIIDGESRYALATEMADRKLPIDCGDFLTYSDSNPLVCTAYKIEAIEKMYAEVGLEIVRIDRGSWRGAAYRNEANHYQDIVLSRPSTK